MTADVQEEASIQWTNLTRPPAPHPLRRLDGRCPVWQGASHVAWQAVSSALSSSKDKGLIVGSGRLRSWVDSLLRVWVFGQWDN